MQYILGIGSNTGNRLSSLQDARDNLLRIGTLESCSKIYESEPFGPKKQPPFLNAVCMLQCELGPSRLLRKLKSIEALLGRQRTYRWGPREIDIDIIDYNGLPVKDDLLNIPHPEMANRRFVLIPLAEIFPKYTNRDDEPVTSLIDRCADNGQLQVFKNQW